MLAALCLCAGCPKSAPKPAAQAPPPIQVLLTLREAQPVRNSKQVARLCYDVASPAGVGAMELTDPKQPQGADIKLDLCTVKAQPFVGKPQIIKSRLRECRVDCCYTLCVRDTAGTHVGDFEIIDWGTLVLKKATVAKELEYDLITTAERAVYLFYRAKPGKVSGDLELALEFVPNKALTRRELVAGDGWHYTFWSPDGILKVYDHASLGELNQDLAWQASAESSAREQDIEAWRKESARQKCRTGGG